LVIKTLNSELDPDPQIGKMLASDPHKINADPHSTTLPDALHFCISKGMKLSKRGFRVA
jgi:hypothetical protein